MPTCPIAHLGDDVADGHLEVLLTMAGRSAVVLATAEFHDVELLAFDGAIKLPHHLSTRDQRLTNASVRAFADRQDLIELDRLLISGQIADIHVNLIARCYFVLSAAVFNNRVHV